MQEMLRAEHGGMNEVLVEVFAITKDEKYLAAARRFSDRQILDPMSAGRDGLTGKHANTQIPKVIGFQRIGDLSATRDDSSSVKERSTDHPQRAAGRKDSPCDCLGSLLALLSSSPVRSALRCPISGSRWSAP